MFCAISGVAPKHAVADKNGSLYERELIEAYIEQHGRDPINNEPLSKEDLLELHSSPFTKPRAPSETSIPNTLMTLQNEWDALMIETFELRKRNFELQKQLTNALYESDAAKRVIARLLVERDEARKQLSEYNASIQSKKVDADVEMLPAESVSKLPDAVVKELDAKYQE